MFGLVPKGFIPSEDTGQVLINTEGAQGVSYENMVQYQQQLAAIVAKDPNVEAYFSSVGVGRRRPDRQHRPYLYETQTTLRAASGVLPNVLD